MSNNASHQDKRIIFQVAIGFFLLAALLGLLMRFIYLQEIPWLDYKHVLNAHSHLAMLGWGFMALGGTLVFSFISKVASLDKYRNAFYGNLIAGVGMFFAFLYQGYGAISITFSTLHLFVAYYFAWCFLKDLRKVPTSNATKFAKWAVYLMVISTLGLWSIAPVSIFLGKLHPLYFASIQFFLHFQFNGWFTYGILALVFKHSEDNGYPVQLPKFTFAVLQVSVVLTYILSVTWSTPENILFYINSVGVLLQLLAFGMLWKGFSQSAKFSFESNSIISWLFRMGILSLGVKVIIQTAVAIPFIAKVSYTIRNLAIGFIHLSMLGAFSLTLIAILIYQNLLPTTKVALNGYRLLALGFILTEAILFLQGVFLWVEFGFIPNYHELLFGVTLLLPVALILIIASFSNK